MIFGSLLADGAASAPAFSRHALLYGILDFHHIETVVLEKPLVFGSHDGYGQVLGHFIQRNPMVFQPDFFASADLLCTADEHERGDRYGDKAVENNKKDCTPEEREYNPLNQFLNFFHLSD